MVGKHTQYKSMVVPQDETHFVEEAVVRDRDTDFPTFLFYLALSKCRVKNLTFTNTAA